MFLLIFESIGTSELILIGIVALMFLGPRKLPMMARKAAKIMAEFRGTANEFKETWRKEVDFEEEKKALQFAEEDETVPIPRVAPGDALNAPPPPVVKTIDPAEMPVLNDLPDTDAVDPEPRDASKDKVNWL